MLPSGPGTSLYLDCWKIPSHGPVSELEVRAPLPKTSVTLPPDVPYTDPSEKSRGDVWSRSGTPVRGGRPEVVCGLDFVGKVSPELTYSP